ncbi:MAG: hypothetical protein NTW14_06240 [bacterium]|nr:hypothetical protein [bacterium]
MSIPNPTPNPASHLFFQIGIVCCPHCDVSFTLNCEDLNTRVWCQSCGKTFIYVDAFLNHYRRDPRIFIDPIHPIPIAPGYTSGGETPITPDEIQVIAYGVLYNRPPELFFLNEQGKPSRDLLLDNLYVAAVSINAESFILLSRTFNRAIKPPAYTIRWMAIGEIGKHEKPIWIDILQNAAGLILKSEEQAALVMLQVALDFFIDALMEQLGFKSYDVKTASRRWKISDRRTKLRLIEERIGSFSKELTTKLINLAEQRNRLVHGKTSRKDIETYSGSDAFVLIVEAINAINELKYSNLRQPIKLVKK